MALRVDFNNKNLHQCSRVELIQQLALKHLHGGFKKATSSSDNPKIPDPNLFNFTAEPKDARKECGRLPSIAECAVHLELLQAFRYLRIEILSSMALSILFGINPEYRTVFRKRVKWEGWTKSLVREEVKLRDENFEKKREKVWPLYLKLAASRFLSWIAAVEDFDRTNAPNGLFHLPPIDVLMVWHALLLNPKWFRSFEQRELKYLSTISFPWEQIHAAIDADSSKWSFKQSEADQAWFRDNCGLHPNFLEYLTKEQKSEHVSQYLTNYGKSLDSDGGHELDLESVSELSSSDSDSDPDPPELKFLDVCRIAAGGDDTIENLVDAVKRQSAFVDKMDKQLWIRSPAVEGTLSRAIIRYERFLKLFKLYPRTMLVPTLDIDLAWHTHQCSPARYEAETAEIAGRFVDHNDKLGTATLDPAFEKTKALYRIRFADDYQTCVCWDCEALRSAIADDDHKVPTDSASVAGEAQTTVAYYRAVEIARQTGEELLPIRDTP
ncbi:hypothetical protein NUW58_g5505 [Xylaria curta]|uniref:Uncharacterized protein n=1 Tax=Xylaria curta TaxID=42375 RepID=A0ACC1P1S4_9PEZI|nr:hypothetical protein NUW58_g5505 [Xylaria curta]